MGKQELSLLLPFCQYLLHRVRTDNLDLLKRIVSESLCNPPSYTTLATMVRISYPVVAILPLDHDDADERARAEAILARMKMRHADSQNDRQADYDEIDLLTKTLAAHITTHNWDWLARIYEDFCVGDESCLTTFIALQRQAISLIPVSPLLQPQQQPLQQHGRRKRRHQAAEQPEASDSKAIREVRRRPKPAAQEICLRIYKETQAIAETKPWEQLFDLSQIEYRFDATKYPHLASGLDRFWLKYAQVVWERQFWCRCTTEDQQIMDQQEERKIRQDNATRSFELWVIVPIFDAFGAQFFVDMDKQPEERHYWWWYRRPVVDLVRMSQLIGVESCLAYVRSRAKNRFANPPIGFQSHPHRHKRLPSSMWSTLAKLDYIRTAIDAFQAKPKHSSSSGEKEATSENGFASSSNEDEDSVDEDGCFPGRGSCIM